MRTFVSALLFAAATVVVLTGSPGTADDKKDEKKAAGELDGGYTIVSGQKDGKAIPEGEIKGSLVRFTGDKIVGTDKDKKEFFAATYTIDKAKTPWAIKMTSHQPKESTANGLIKKEGDTITIVYALPGGETPKEFKAGEKQHLFVLKNMNPVPNKFTKE
ncbi:TIGR03067 domain-containing protein [Gemmata sp. JC673]|uniref:TIGR03067 domain-containing protein n=1 Tax=Gemmata algarum TaxID=2975278 RepID=A0ABU5EX32_9BACT|nr:TIGR03067 domain-containing protein [Gemmata algarum]MDY3559741.1 TIGR03067 domain-containing protein [Gemmata algarum]